MLTTLDFLIMLLKTRVFFFSIARKVFFSVSLGHVQFRTNFPETWIFENYEMYKYHQELHIFIEINNI